MRAFRGVGVAVWVAMSLLAVAVSPAFASSPPPIGPFILQGRLSGPPLFFEEGQNAGGASVALSSDGNTALIGGHNADWVYTRTGSTWSLQARLIPSDASEFKDGGKRVALSGDGNTALIGGRTDKEVVGQEEVGAVWVFTRSGSTWTQQGEKLIGGGEIGNGQFGASVALASDGKTALIGGPGDSSGVGAAWVFTRSHSTWTQQGEKLTGAGESGNGRFGRSVALSSHGNRALIGGGGAAWAFTRSGTTWTQQAELIGGLGGVALSADGNTALTGCVADNPLIGAACVFRRSGKTWTQQGEKLTPGDASPPFNEGVRFGESVALSADANTALIGGPGDFNNFGAAWVFTRSGATWTQQGHALREGSEHPGSFGFSVALGSDGNTALIGCPGCEHFFGEGLVYVNVNPPTVKNVSPDKGPASGGTTVTIHGTDFTGASAVSFGSTNATSFTVNSPTSITATSPPESAGTVDVTVTTAGGTSAASSHDGFEFRAEGH